MRHHVAFAFLLLAPLGPLAADGPSFSLEALPIGVTTDRIMITPDYFWKPGDDLSLYGFVEYSGEDGKWFSNHVGCWTPTGHFGLRAELGADDAGGSFAKVGPRFTFSGAGFSHLQVAPLFVSGTPEFDLSKLSCWWISQKVFIYSSVFAFFEHNILLRV
jgi:hypothetical protein